jgi:hypothetical protein
MTFWWSRIDRLHHKISWQSSKARAKIAFLAVTYWGQS